ncbi:hypothetical protein NU219Hw_g691t1 [Hortaea werneckii]
MSQDASQEEARGRDYTEIDTAPRQLGSACGSTRVMLLASSQDEVDPGTLKGKSLEEALPTKNCVAQRSKGASSDEFCIDVHEDVFEQELSTATRKKRYKSIGNVLIAITDYVSRDTVIVKDKSRLYKAGKTTAKGAAIANERDVGIGERTALAALRQENVGQAKVAEHELSQLRDQGLEKYQKTRKLEAGATSQEDTALRLRNDNRDQELALEENRKTLLESRGNFAQKPVSPSTTDPDEVRSENVLSVPRTVADVRRLLRVSQQVVGAEEILSHGDVVSPDVLNQALNTLEGSQAAREGARGDQTESAAAPSWFRQRTIQKVQGMLDQAAASYNISEAQAIANLREKRGFSDNDENNIIFRILGRRGRPTVLKPHQRIYMDWAHAMEMKYGSSVNGDGCGLGKTLSCVAHILNAMEYWLEQPEDLQEQRPTLIVCPNNIAKKWTKTVRNAVDERWQVWRFGHNASTRHREPNLA